VPRKAPPPARAPSLDALLRARRAVERDLRRAVLFEVTEGLLSAVAFFGAGIGVAILVTRALGIEVDGATGGVTAFVVGVAATVAVQWLLRAVFDPPAEPPKKLARRRRELIREAYEAARREGRRWALRYHPFVVALLRIGAIVTFCVLCLLAFVLWVQHAAGA